MALKSDQPDQKIVEGCINGNKEAWDAFVERFSRLIYWSIQKTLQASSSRDTQEVSAEVFQTMFQALLEKETLSRLRDHQSLPRFLSVMACRMTLDRARRVHRYQKRNISLDEEFSSEDSAAPDKVSLASKEKELCVAKAMQRLSPKERVCVRYHCIKGKTHLEISRLLGISQDTVSTIIRRAKEKIKDELKNKGVLE